VQTIEQLNSIDPELLRSLRAASDRYIQTRDGWLLLRVRLPRQAQVDPTPALGSS
jgi:hypothetical protein